MAVEAFAGIDVGAAATKCVILDAGKKELGSAIVKTGIDLAAGAESVFEEALKGAGVGRQSVTTIVATGFGRKNVPFANSARTEISCQSAGCFFYFPRAIIIVDIGGQDTKVIRTDETGKLRSFKMNRKCAAGTGTFLEEIAHRLDTPLDELNALASKSKGGIELGAYCTVFTATEILSKIREGINKEDLARAVYTSVVKRAMEMDPLVGDVVLTGGVAAHNNVLEEIFSKAIGRKILVPPKPQLTGALGAALYATRAAVQH